MEIVHQPHHGVAAYMMNSSSTGGHVCCTRRSHIARTNQQLTHTSDINMHDSQKEIRIELKLQLYMLLSPYLLHTYVA